MNYTQLTSIPLFTGINGEDLALIMDRVELVHADLYPGEIFVREGEVSHGMAILREGEVTRTQTYNLGTFVNSRKQECQLTYKATETLRGPLIIEPEVLFGLSLRHKNTWMANTSCRMQLIGKEDIRQTLMYVPVWRINFINMLCANLQKCREEAKPHPIPGLTGMVVEFLLKHSSEKGISLEMDITIEQIGHCLSINRRTLGEIFDHLNNDGIVEKGRQKLVVPDLSKLRLYLNKA